MLGKPLIYIQESKQYRSSTTREFECQVYSSSPILVWKLKREKVHFSFDLFSLENNLEIK